MNKRRFVYSSPMILLLIVAVAGWLATDYLGNKARQEIIGESRASVLTLSTYVSSTFANVEAAVKSLAGSPWIAPALISKRDQDIEHANSALDRYNSALNASVSYLMDADGMTVASSNRKDPDSFVGQSYRFRPYFQEAARGQLSHYFALGITSGKRGFYASYPVQNRLSKVLGVVAMKKDLDDMGIFFRKFSFCFLISPDGIIFLSSKPAMVLKSFWPLNKTAQEKLIASQQFGNKLSEDVFLKKEIADGTEVTLEGKDYFVSRKVIDSDGWSIVLLTPTDRIWIYKLTGILATIFVCFLIIVFAGILYLTDRSQEAIRQSEEGKRLLLHAAGEGILGVDTMGQLTFVNPAALRMLGFAEEEMLGQRVHVLIHHSHKDGSNYPMEECPMYASYTKATESRVEEVLWRKDGSSFPVEYSSMPISRDGKVMGAVVTFRDITKRKQAEEALHRSEEKYRTIIENIEDGYFEIDLTGTFTFVNDAQCRIVGTPREQLLGKNNRAYTSEEEAKRLYQIFSGIYITGEPVKGFAFEYKKRDGTMAFTELSASLIKDAEGKPIGFRGISRDITERKHLEEKIQQMAFHDSLTGLPNRKLFSDRLGIALAQAQRNQKKVGIAMLDLDNFKGVNDTLGHDVGDILLQAAAERLSAALRKSDTVARFGGDEFVLIIPDLKAREDAIQVAQKIVDSFCKPFLIDTHQLVVTTSIGIAVYPHDGTDEGMLLKNADIAMYQAKQAGRARYQLYKKA
ncbi:MAG: diguanylate cyclase [Smithellaceae bacterium]|jgi:diguanylate cyclase (GGDEF)-like protein/PAS domain S-box-containing protein